MDKYAKKKDKKNKYTKKEHEAVHDLAERMMGGGHVPDEITNPYALSYWMKGKGYDVKKKPGKPHARVKPFEKKKKKAELMSMLYKIANSLDEASWVDEAAEVTEIMEKLAQDDVVPEDEDVFVEDGPGVDINEPVSMYNTEINTWFERDRAHVELRDKNTDETLMEFWDDDLRQLVEDGFLDPRNWHQSMVEYYKALHG